jgi:pullulanase/glycogen debranching enzyme
MKSVVADPGRYDWEGDLPLRRPFAETLIYELHVRGFTRHSSSGVADARSGTYAGLIEKIPYLKDLGVTAVELMPVFQFDSQDAPEGRSNYWGYQPISFFAPHQAYASRSDSLGVLDEFRDMVNNNAYCLDDERAWLDWSLLRRHADVHRFVRSLARFRQRRDEAPETGRLSLNQLLQRAHVEWHGVALARPDWSDDSHTLAFTLRSVRAGLLFHGMLNAYWEPLSFELPPVSAHGPERWRRCIDTALAPPDDIQPCESAPPAEQAAYRVQPRSVVLLVLAP